MRQGRRLLCIYEALTWTLLDVEYQPDPSAFTSSSKFYDTCDRVQLVSQCFKTCTLALQNLIKYFCVFHEIPNLEPLIISVRNFLFVNINGKICFAIPSWRYLSLLAFRQKTAFLIMKTRLKRRHEYEVCNKESYRCSMSKRVTGHFCIFISKSASKSHLMSKKRRWIFKLNS